MNLTNLHSKNILIAGAGSGIGLALAKQLTAAQATVYAFSRTPVPKALEGKIHFLSFDILRDDFGRLPEFLSEKLHGLVYCPGSIRLKPFLRLTENDFLADFHLNCLGAAKTIQAAIPSLKKGAPASVVLFSTVAVEVGLPFHASIATAKAGVGGLAKSLAAEYAPSQIRFNVIAPSLTETPLAAPLLNTDSKRENAAKRHPLQRIGQAEEIAATARFLLDDAASWMTGQILPVDGGLSSIKSMG